ncbi:MAG: methyltransferase domain-containing protein [Acidimicrobiia bacterium]
MSEPSSSASPDQEVPPAPHASLDLESRRLKAMKIERMLQPRIDDGPVRVLEIGTGSGGIAHYLAAEHPGSLTVTAVDVRDQRMVADGFTFRRVDGTTLPFEGGSFDIVISNHVIEHVGGRSDQVSHLAEMRRLLARGGLGFLSVPNRWALVEPHFRLPFLSWVPRRWRTSYVRYAGRGDAYDCEPLSRPDLDSMLSETGFMFQHREVEAMRVTLELEGADTLARRLARAVPDWFLTRLTRLSPTFVCTFWIDAE